MSLQVTGVIVHPDGQIISCALDKYAVQTNADVSALLVLSCSGVIRIKYQW